MSFSEISEVVPWLELASDQGQDVDGPQYGDAEMLPRFSHSHQLEIIANELVAAFHAYTAKYLGYL